MVSAIMAALPASAADSICPETISVKQTGVAPAPEWSVSTRLTPIQLEMVTFYSGPPKDEASLVYAQFVRAKDASIATWTFPKDPRGYWVKCTYSGTTVELAKPLPPTVTSCHVAYSRESSSPSGLPSIRRSFCQ